MKSESVSDALLRQFLLGKVNEEDCERIEELFLTDSALRERVHAVEQDLIEDYLEDSLSSADREAFVLRYAQTAEQQRKLRITRSIKDWAVASDSARGVAGETVDSAASVAHEAQSGPTVARSLWSRLWEKLRLRPVFVIPVAAVIILGIVFAVIWLNRRMQHSAIEQEIARLNAPASLREAPLVQNAPLVRPGTLRDGESRGDLRPRADEAVIELHLHWTMIERFPKYQAVLTRFSDNQTFAIPELHTEGDGKTIRLRLPTRILSRGLYRVHLSGVTADGSVSPPQDYSFTVVN